eukprot:CAMPEP_0178723828 /NCGR_PEP_ID=MMETSP0699-20121125/25767_1 /TAXON_ID=265572 /ORGANISM="Extubocellulus spinifer, Strain CCMP396" /LENGTH=185 /DNA_ID=CAMNT_0020374959 /DNA_START=1119 /DNA_END=1677 /DNA_ORIENTATION=-
MNLVNYQKTNFSDELLACTRWTFREIVAISPPPSGYKIPLFWCTDEDVGLVEGGDDDDDDDTTKEDGDDTTKEDDGAKEGKKDDGKKLHWVQVKLVLCCILLFDFYSPLESCRVSPDSSNTDQLSGAAPNRDFHSLRRSLASDLSGAMYTHFALGLTLFIRNNPSSATMVLPLPVGAPSNTGVSV